MMSRIQTWLESFFSCSVLQANSPKFKELFPKNAKLEKVATGFQFTEGPVWIEQEKCLLFSDIPANKIYKLSHKNQVSLFKEPSYNSNGLTRDIQGRLLACEHGKRRVTRIETDGSVTILASVFQDKKLNSPNDIVVKSNGYIYFTDPPYGIKPEQQEQPTQGVYRLSPDGEEIVLLVSDFNKPNGLAFSTDETKLYIDDSQECHIRFFDVLKDGTLDNGRIFYDMKTDKAGLPDGMKIDTQGNIFCTGGGGVWVFSPEGEHLGTIATPEPPANCAWGDSDQRSLYITARTSIYKIRVNISGNSVF
ncbi:SMP-30/gluconolactonase/LRE family protein [Anabaena sp. UHCC 0451]|uniref:SMP-30/gluconolactonase/LRE family protein n=1 Tax=Anabaena sp. UHCC 0451 TaxID=2055235 RepID=UPI002B20B118|nr:SMP-30/gluconolactonase/LRE family protein [Anabaena sp. UHCC 0451]MEA5578906.1 SMP-30/gluconolactonase/LRE family protein [Anabaena sp. UHCC 0451]